MARKPLSQLKDWELVDEEQDLRGRKLLDPDGAPLGTIRDMIVDTESGYVEGVVLEDGTTYGAREFELRQGAAVLLEPPKGARRQSAPGRRGAKAPVPPIPAEDDLATAPRGPRDVGEEEPPIIIPLRGEELYVERVAVLAGEIVIDKRAVRFTEQITDTVRREEVEVVSTTDETPATTGERIPSATGERRPDPPGL